MIDTVNLELFDWYFFVTLCYWASATITYLTAFISNNFSPVFNNIRTIIIIFSSSNSCRIRQLECFKTAVRFSEYFHFYLSHIVYTVRPCLFLSWPVVRHVLSAYPFTIIKVLITFIDIIISLQIQHRDLYWKYIQFLFGESKSSELFVFPKSRCWPTRPPRHIGIDSVS